MTNIREFRYIIAKSCIFAQIYANTTMLTSISIENFRCFEKAEFSGFSLINVLGGENNAGKTALLEAIYLVCGNPLGEPIKNIFRFRQFELDKYRGYLSQKIFDNLFWNQDSSKNISIIKNNTDADFVKFRIDNWNLVAEYYFGKYYIATHGGIDRSEIASYELEKLHIIPIEFLPTKYEMSSLNLVKAYEELDYNRKDAILLNAFQIIDPSIEGIKTYSANPLSLHIARKGEKYLPLSFFGDAMNKMAYYILHIIKAAKGILLIDEIENGIHHDHQRDFWRALLLLAKEYEVQIFATSHSLEMIRAYNDVAMDLVKENVEFAEVCHYFEMARHAKTQQITAIKMNMNMLHRKIVKNNPFRGE